MPPMADPEKVPLALTVTASLRDEIDLFAANAGRELGVSISRSAAMEILLRAGLKAKTKAGK